MRILTGFSVLCVCALSAIGIAVTSAACDSAGAPTTPPIVTPLATFLPRPTPANDVTTPADATPSANTARVITHGNASRRAIALTFDAATGAGNTADILRTLREHNIRATFVLTGVWAERHRDLLFAIAAEGHQIINNTYDHRSFTGASTGQPPLAQAERALELSRTEVTVYRYTSQTTKPYFRPPYGDYDDSVLLDAASNGYDAVVTWTLDTLGWNGATADQIVARSVAAAEPGVVYAMHVGSTSQDAAALPRIIEALSADGYAFETVAEIVK